MSIIRLFECLIGLLNVVLSLTGFSQANEKIRLIALFLQGPPGEQGLRGEAGAKGDKVRDKKNLFTNLLSTASTS